MQMGYAKNRDSRPISGSLRVVNARPLSVIHTAAPGRGKLVTLIAGKRGHLLFAKTTKCL